MLVIIADLCLEPLDQQRQSASRTCSLSLALPTRIRQTIGPCTPLAGCEAWSALRHRDRLEANVPGLGHMTPGHMG